MKNLRPIARLLLVGAGLTWLSAGCDTGEGGTTPQNGCRLARITSTSRTPLGNTSTVETAYDYDAAGNLLKQTKTSAYTYSAGGSENTTSVDAYTYNANNYLLSSTTSAEQKTTSLTGKVSTYQLTATTTYTYANERLTEYGRKSSVFDSNITSRPQPQTYTEASTYEYDASGQLTKQSFGSGQTWTYRNGLAVGHTGSYPLILESGLITKASFPGTMGLGDGTTRPYNLDQVFQYDAQRRLTQYQEFYNDTLKNYRTQEWQTAKPAHSALPVFKGHPIVKSASGEQGVLTSQRLYMMLTQPAGAFSKYHEVIYTNQLNVQGFVTSIRQENLRQGSGQPDVTTTTYTYTGCN